VIDGKYKMSADVWGSNPANLVMFCLGGLTGALDNGETVKYFEACGVTENERTILRAALRIVTEKTYAYNAGLNK
jgi:hypothetical protein